MLQVRGSIPLYWNQEGITTLKPDITLQHYDPLYTATRLHFEVSSMEQGYFGQTAPYTLTPYCEHGSCLPNCIYLKSVTDFEEGYCLE